MTVIEKNIIARIIYLIKLTWKNIQNYFANNKEFEDSETITPQTSMNHLITIGQHGCCPNWLPVTRGDSIVFRVELHSRTDLSSIVCLNPPELFDKSRLVILPGKEEVVQVKEGTQHNFYAYSAHYNVPSGEVDQTVCPGNSRLGGGGEVSPPTLV